MTTVGSGEGQNLPAAGWYPDAANPDRERLWTGSRWIDWIRPVRVERTEDNPVAWHPDPEHPGFERLWSGEMWTEEIRRAAPAGDAAPVAGSPLAIPVSEQAQPVAGAVPSQPHGTQAPFAQPLRPAPQISRRPATVYHDDRPPSRLGALGTWVGVAFAAVIAAAIAQLIADQIYIGVESDILDGRSPELSHVESVVSAVHTTHAITFVVEGITAILFVIWFYRAYRNLVRAGVWDLRFGPGWAIGGWFIPIFNLIRQKQIANDIWKASASAGTVGLERRWEIGLSGVLNWWWGTWILGGLLVAIGNGAVTRANKNVIYTFESLRHERTGVWFTQVGLLVVIAAAVLAYLFVRDVSRMQDESFEATAPGSYSTPSHAWSLSPPASPAGVFVPPASSGAASTKTCPECAEQVKSEAHVCRFCGHRFDATA